MEFLKKLTEKILDFFNFGRFVTIFLPGLLIAMAVTMFVSQLLFPRVQTSMVGRIVVAAAQADLVERPNSPGKPLGTVEKGESLTIIGENGGWYQVELLAKSPGKVKAKREFKPKLKKGETLTITGEQGGAYQVELAARSQTKLQFEGIAVTPRFGDSLTIIDPSDKWYQVELLSKRQGWIRANLADKAAPPDSYLLFRSRFQEDFGRLWGHSYLVALLAIVFGLMNYELGYWVLKCRWFEQADDEKLYPYDPAHDADPSPAQKFQPRQGNSVGLVYFTPFLKEKFSGEENYFDFLIAEYYRFVEVSVVIPLALIQSSVFGVFYCWLFWKRHHAGLDPLWSAWLGMVSFGGAGHHRCSLRDLSSMHITKDSPRVLQGKS